MKKILSLTVLAVALLIGAAPARAFCGFYVAKADAKLFNRASRVAIARSGERTVITMANDYQGSPKEFGIVIPVPTFIEREQIHVGDRAVLDHLDAYSAPRLVEYFDPDPCRYEKEEMLRERSAAKSIRQDAPSPRDFDDSLGVTVEASYTVGEYDIQILSAEQSDGLTTWLRAEGYRLPDGAEAVLGSYLKQGMRFFVAKVNLGEQEKLGVKKLRPIQVAYESPKFMLPIRLGTLNADGEQELFVFLLTPEGRVETTNYRTVRLPSGMDLPVFVKNEFGDVYRDMFARQVEKENRSAVFLEYAWNMASCDPCAADPLSNEELQQLGAWWTAPGNRRRGGGGGSNGVFITRLHVRYDGRTFPEDLRFQETGDRSNFQARYVLRHAYEGAASCPEADSYRAGLPDRWEREVATMASLTGWDPEKVRERMKANGQRPRAKNAWWKRIWKD